MTHVPREIRSPSAPTNGGPAGGHAANPQPREERCLFRSTYSVRKIEPKRQAAQ